MPLGRSSITAFLKGLTGASPFNVLYRNYSSFFSPLGMALYLFYFINMGLFIYLLSQEYGFVKGESLRNLFILILFVSTLFWLKQIVIRVLGGIFPIQKEVAKYSFLIGVLSSLLGLFLFPINLTCI